MRLVLTIPVGLLTLLVAFAAGQGDEDVLKKRFLAEYPAALKAWQARFSNSVGTVRSTGTDAGGKEDATPHEMLLSFRCKMPSMAVLTASGLQGQFHDKTVHIYNQNYSCNLKAAGAGQTYVIDSLEAAKGPDYVPRSSPIWNLLWTPYSIQYPIGRLISNPRFIVRRVSPLERNGKKLLKVEFEYAENPKAANTKSPGYWGGLEGYFLASPDEKWVLYEFESRQTKGSRLVYKGTVEYEGTVDGFPIPKRKFAQRYKPNETKPISSGTLIFEEFAFADLPDRDFTLAAFGLPEQVAQPRTVTRRGTMGYWLLAFAMIALAGAVGFNMAASRLKRRAIRG